MMVKPEADVELLKPVYARKNLRLLDIDKSRDALGREFEVFRCTYRDNSKYTGAKLRELRKERGVGRPRN